MFKIVQSFCVVMPYHCVARKSWIDMRSQVRRLPVNMSRNITCLQGGCRYAFVRNMKSNRNDSKSCKVRTFCATVALQGIAASHVLVNEEVQNPSAKQHICTVAAGTENIWSRTWFFVKLVFRVLQLYVIFTPVVLLMPLLYMGRNCRECWFKLLLYGVEVSGPVIMKLGQWASTRRDLFSEEFCFHMSKLQRKVTPHSWHYTEEILKKSYGPIWNQVIKEINTVPIGSGCCAQVYKAWVEADIIRRDRRWNKGIPDGGLLPVAVKVVHPNMNELLRRDLSILRAAAISVSWLFPSLKWLSLEECVDDFTQLMSAQVDMLVEAQNLERFAKNFAGITTVRFPQPVWSLTQSDILVETFESGEPLLNYVTSDSTKKVKMHLANIGINTILKMVFDDNFAHGDLHPGNMLVQRVSTLDQQNSVFPLLKQSSPAPFRLVILDCGIAASLDERGKKALRDVFTAVVNGDGRKVAELFLAHSNHGCTDTESFKQSMDKIVNDALNKTVTLEKIQISSLMTSLFTTMINHKVKLDGSFSSVILAIMVLEGLGRSLDPTADIVEKAKPFLIGVF